MIELNEFFSVLMLQPQLSGNRVVKRFYQPASTLKHTTWYARDAQGNVLSIYERATPTSDIMQTEVHIYGSSRLGIEQRNITYSTSPFAWLESEQHRHAGTKRYELTDHLGNVRVTISDLLVPRPASSFGYVTQDAEVIDRRDYYPFGMEMPGRRWRAATEGAGRYGYNGKENDNEVKGEGNQQDFGARIQDPRLGGRFLSIDPLASKLSGISPYAFAMNNPISMFDAGGLYPFTVHIRSYHPNAAFGSFGMGKGYHGDNRGFSLSTAKDVTARVTQQFTFDVAKGNIDYDKAKGTWSDESRDFNGNKETAQPRGEVSEMSKFGNVGTFNSSYEANNPLVPGSPDIDVEAKFTVTEDTERGVLTVKIDASGDDFPNTEAFLTDASGQSLFLGVDVREMGNDAAPFILVGGANTPIMNNTLSVSLDKKGNFKDVYSGGKKYSIGDWNKRFTDTDAKPTDKK